MEPYIPQNSTDKNKIQVKQCKGKGPVSSHSLRCMGTPPSFFRHVFKGRHIHDFLFAYLEDKVFPNWGLILKLWWEQIRFFKSGPLMR